MEQYVAGGVSAAISQGDPRKQKVKIKNYNSKESSQITTSNKKSQFTCNSNENYVKYRITSSSTEKIHKEKNELKENKNKRSYPFKQAVHLNSSKNSESRRGRKRKFELNEVGKIEVAETELVNTTKPKNRKIMGGNQSKKNPHDDGGMTDTISSNNCNNLQRKNNQMEKLIKNDENQNSAKEEDRTIYVGNLPLKYDHKKVAKLFSKFGKIENARIRCVPVPSFGFPKKKAAITKKFNANRNSVSAYVVFKNEESVSKAVKLNGMVVEEHHIRIDKAVPQKKDLKKSVFVGGLPFDIEDDELWDFFKDCGEIDSVRIVRDNKFSMGKGFGYVNFKSSASVELALALDSYEIKNRKINVQRCISKKKKDFKKSSSLKKGRKSRNQRHHKNFSSKSDNKNSSKHDFQGREAQHKQKRKKRKLTKDVARKNRIISTLKLSSKKNKNGNKKSNN